MLINLVFAEIMSANCERSCTDISSLLLKTPKKPRTISNKIQANPCLVTSNVIQLGNGSDIVKQRTQTLKGLSPRAKFGQTKQ